MKIAVPIKWVTVLDDQLDGGFGEIALDRSDMAGELNDWDRFSLEAALELREMGEGSEVIVITVGGEESEEGLLACLARGADRAVRIADERCEDEPLAVACVLAKALVSEQPDLILCGAQSADAGHAATGIALAGLLGINRVALVRRLQLEPSGGAVRVERELEGGRTESLRVKLPCLLTIQTGINEPRYANLRGMRQARAKPMDVGGIDELGLSPDDLAAARGSRMRALSVPSRQRAIEFLEGEQELIAHRIAEIIEERLGR